MGKEIEMPTDYSLTLDFVDQPIQIDIDTNSNMEATINTNMSADLTSQMNLGPIIINPIKVDMGLDNINMESKIDMGLDNIKADLCLSVGIREFPKMRIHFPVNYEFGLELFGMRVFNFSICGKSMVVTEDNPVKLFHAPHSSSQRHEGMPTFKVSFDE